MLKTINIYHFVDILIWKQLTIFVFMEFLALESNTKEIKNVYYIFNGLQHNKKRVKQS